MANLTPSSLLELPVELVYRILENLDYVTILCSVHNVCTRLNMITGSYAPYKTMNTLDLRADEIVNMPVTRIIDALQHNTTVTTLCGTDHKVGDNEVTCIASTLQQQTALTTLDLRNNGISVKGTTQIADALQHNTVIPHFSSTIA
ncbi:unnamed protein product [Rotaria magnacalcarata]|uniref:F-box domain-containing protein n=1 Tax=Rotaria magnacalcarata TaxID=392030 RepID=A0A8S3D7U6_9BILA|nr:unnamed protein product [Rotaria magnacalcarata]